MTYATHPGPTLDAPGAFRKAAAGEILLIDIRRPDEWQANGSGKGAHRLDLQRPDFVEALSALAAGDRNHPIALICAKGVRSARLADLLSEIGFSNVSNVTEGMLGSSAGPGLIVWGLPVVKD